MIGHTVVRSYLERELPPATMLYGPPSVGKWTLATHLADHHRVHPIDRWSVEYGMTVDTVKLITHFAARAPHGTYKLVIARLDDVRKQALNAMLKTLEEPPPRVRFLFTATQMPIPTIASRCTCFEMGILSLGELEAIYQEQGLTQHRARLAARHARGNVGRGFTFERTDQHRAQVLAVVQAIVVGDRDQFAGCFTEWDGRSTELLRTLLNEALTHRWSTFKQAEACGLEEDRRRLWFMVGSLARLAQARPRLGVRAALEPFLTPR